MKLADRMKEYESQLTQNKLIPLLPIVARLDGKNFSNFTRSLNKPYDSRLSKLMIEVTKYLVKETNANIGYTQSDEITLIWYSSNIKTQTYYNGKIFKIITDLSAMCSVYFNRIMCDYIPEKSEDMPRFDARVFNVPTLEEASNALLWRELDATKNSISMAAQTKYSSEELKGMNSNVKQEMLFDKGINWNDYPAYFKRGTYIQRKERTGKMTIDEIEKLPPLHNARKEGGDIITRKYTEELDLRPLNQVNNKVDVVLFGEDPIYLEK